MLWWAALDEETRGQWAGWFVAIVIIAAIAAIFPGSTSPSSTHSRLRPPKAGCIPGQVMAPDGSCVWRGPSGGPGADAPARATARSDRDSAPASAPRPHTDPASNPNPDGAWVDTAGIVLAFAVAAVAAVALWREERPRLARPADRRRSFRAA
jgi:hypothetical protein